MLAAIVEIVPLDEFALATGVDVTTLSAPMGDVLDHASKIDQRSFFRGTSIAPLSFVNPMSCATCQRIGLASFGK